MMKKMLFAAALAGVACLASCSNKSGGVQMGSLSKFDSLSYAIGVNIASGIEFQMKDIPFDFKTIEKALKEGALGKASQTQEESVGLLRDYFMTKRPERTQAIAARRAEADSVRLAQGDSTKVEHPVADEAMFESEEERERISYAFGNDIGCNLAQNKIPLQVVWVGEALLEMHEGNPRMTANEAGEYLQYYFMVKIPAENAAASKAWLEKIEKKSGVQKTESGLLYKVESAGDPNLMPTSDRDKVKVHYTGRMRDGKVFDSSRFAQMSKERQDILRQQFPDAYDEKGNPLKDDEPVEFQLNHVIPGWTEGVKLVGKGGKITLWIPSELAYGSRGAGRDIAANEALEFEIEVIDVIPYEAPAPAAEKTSSEPAEEK